MYSPEFEIGCCFLCKGTLDIDIDQTETARQLQTLFDYVSSGSEEINDVIKEEQVDIDLLEFCGRCRERLEFFFECHHQALLENKAPVDLILQESVKDVCRAILEDEDEDFGKVRNKILEKCISFLEEVPANVEGDENVTPPSSASEDAEVGYEGPRQCQSDVSMADGNKHVLRERGRKLQVPEHIKRQRRIQKGDRNLPRYHCLICNRNFSSASLFYHRNRQCDWNAMRQKARKQASTPSKRKRSKRTWREVVEKPETEVNLPEDREDPISSSASTSTSQEKETSSKRGLSEPVKEPETEVNCTEDPISSSSVSASTSTSQEKEEEDEAVHRPGSSEDSTGSKSLPIHYDQDKDIIIMGERASPEGTFLGYLYFCTICQGQVTNAWLHRNGERHKQKRAAAEKSEPEDGNVSRSPPFLPVRQTTTAPPTPTPVKLKLKSSSTRSSEAQKIGIIRRNPKSQLPDFIARKGKVFKYGRDLGLYHCSQCNEDVLSMRLARHKRKHGIGLDVCEVCGKAFKWRRSYVRHRAKNSCNSSSSTAASGSL